MIGTALLLSSYNDNSNVDNIPINNKENGSIDSDLSTEDRDNQDNLDDLD